MSLLYLVWIFHHCVFSLGVFKGIENGFSYYLYRYIDGSSVKDKGLCVRVFMCLCTNAYCILGGSSGYGYSVEKV